MPASIDRTPPTLSRKDALITRLQRHPWLELVLLIVLYDRWFRWVLGAMAVLALGGVLALLKVWRITPRDFEPVVHVSWLDLYQARVFRRTAAQDFEAGRVKEGLQAYMLAVANNPGDVGLLREYLEKLASSGDPQRHSVAAARSVDWLLRLTQTNLIDLELAGRLYDRFALDEMTVRLLASRETSLSPTLQRVYAKALFKEGHAARFVEWWPELQRQGRAGDDPELPLYHAAFLAGWTDGDSARQGQEALDQAKAVESQAILAHHLQLLVSFKLKQQQACAESLEFLQNHRSDRLREHTAYWQLLVELDQRKAAIESLQSYAGTPHSDTELVLLARSYYELGLADGAREVLRQHARGFPHSVSVWLSYANLLTDQERWTDLYALAFQLRSETNPGRLEMMGFSYYLEGLAESHQHQDALANATFQRILQWPISNDLLVAKVAEGLQRLGYPAIAQGLLLQARTQGGADPNYWNLVARSAFDLRDADLMTFALATAHKLAPNDPVIAQNYAAALLTLRTLPAEAIRSTLERMNSAPHLPASRLNHAAALAQNQRISEAEALLRTLNPAGLTELEANALRLVWFEVYYKERDFTHALETEQQINPKLLFPPERQWLDNALAEIRKSTAGVTSTNREAEHSLVNPERPTPRRN